MTPSAQVPIGGSAPRVSGPEVAATRELPADHLERVYAGCLGKVLGVYLGRPVEMWSHERIVAELGEVDYFVADRLGVPLVVTDDDITGTFTFVRALTEHGVGRDVTAAQIGQTWLDHIVEGRTILWWSGVGNSTEHTAYVRLRNGVPAPRSGSAELNGKVVSEQIGAQIFIDGWALVSPGDPAGAARLAGRAASVSHDGEAVSSAQLLAAMEAQAFVESDIDVLLDSGLSFVPADSVVATLVADLRRWHTTEPDWRVARRQLELAYGNHVWGGNCHTIPNLGVIILALLWGGGDWDRSMSIVTTCGWDTDCNAGNLGCLLGIRNGLDAFTARDWRGPVADRMYLPTADGGRAITDIATEAVRLADVGRALDGLPPLVLRDGARFHFQLPGSVQGFTVPAGHGTAVNVEAATPGGSRCLRITAAGPSRLVATTATFIPPEARHMREYELLASPTLYPGQRVRAAIAACPTNTGTVGVRLVVTRYGTDDLLVEIPGPTADLEPGQEVQLAWTLPGTGGQPITTVGLAVSGPFRSPAGASAAAPATGGAPVLAARAGAGGPGRAVHLHWLTWDGTPQLVLGRPPDGGSMWHRAWVDAVDDFGPDWPESFRPVQNEGRGLVLHGTREWGDLVMAADLTPHLASAVGIAVHVQGLHRYHALLLGADGVARLIRCLDGDHVLASAPLGWELGRTHQCSLEVVGTRLRATVDGGGLFDVEDPDSRLTSGAVGLVVDDGRVGCRTVTVGPAPHR